MVGTAIARTLARYSLELVLLDAAPDVGTGTSKANTAILHTGFDAKPGSLESRLLRRGSALLRAYAEAAGIAVERTGALLVAWTPEQAAALPAIEQNAAERVPEVDRMFGGDGFTIAPRRGELIVFDKLARRLIRSILLPVPTARTKGVLVAPTVYGNVLVGPTAEDVADRGDTATTAAGLGSLVAAGRRILPGLAAEEVTSTYAGLRPLPGSRTTRSGWTPSGGARARRHPLHRAFRLARDRGARRRAAGEAGSRCGRVPAGRCR